MFTNLIVILAVLWCSYNFEYTWCAYLSRKRVSEQRSEGKTFGFYIKLLKLRFKGSGLFENG